MQCQARGRERREEGRMEMQSQDEQNAKKNIHQECHLPPLWNNLVDARLINPEDEFRVTPIIDDVRSIRNLLGDQTASVDLLQSLCEHAGRMCSMIESYVIHLDVDQSQSIRTLVRVAVQCLGNAVTRQETGHVFRKCIWRHGEGVSFFITLLRHADEKVRVFGSMVLYNCLSEPAIMEGVAGSRDILECVLETVSPDEVQNDWYLFIVQRMVTGLDTFVEQAWSTAGHVTRMNLLGIIQSTLLEYSDILLNERNLSFLASIFVTGINRLIGLDRPEVGEVVHPTIREPGHPTTREVDRPMLSEEMNGPSTEEEEMRSPTRKKEMELLEVLLDTLCLATSSEGRYGLIRDDQRLLVASLEMLKFSRRPETNQLRELERMASSLNSVTDERSPSSIPVNFRAHLVQLLANMCYKHPRNQKCMRDEEGIAVIMDCTQLDADNPFITQWAIFALKNLLEDCPENQTVVASLQPIGILKEKGQKNEGPERRPF